ncbi:M50 family metallopeptidase [Evansella tamaricis]|uniref:M50 family metallopeptidase n=1 Tax=Evansella tamaricis TaxID=2069301 RepID=A0ABS6JEP9_9BACI|nr:M50 family metallopeptidase [Evansella tamaricis]MBU9712138.1 M50 family metallopeptidase [Evansella tamaricis]
MLIYLMLAVVVTFTPLLRTVFGTFNTLVHETGHAIVTLLTSGKVYSVSLFSNLEGVAITGYRSWFSGLIIFYSGYTFSTLMAIASFHFIYLENSMMLFYLLVSFALVNLLLWVRNPYGIFWLLLFLLFAFVLELQGLNQIREMFIMLIASILLIQSITTAFTVFILSVMKSKQAGDATELAKLTSIPAFIWGMVFFGQSVLGAYYVFDNYF